MTLTFLYRCRRCGTIDRNPKQGFTPGDTLFAVMHLLNAIDKTQSEAMAPRLLSIHSCGPDTCGIADLIGFEPDK